MNLALVVDAELFRLDSVVAGSTRRMTVAPHWPSHHAATATSAPGPTQPASAAASSRGSSDERARLSRVSKVYGSGATEVHALRGVDLTVEPGELVAVMGPSGSGKSTLLTIAGSLEQPTGGEVTVGGVAAVEPVPQRAGGLRRRSIGYVFQDFNLLAGLTAAENVSLPLELDGIAARTARPVAIAALERLGMADRADRFPDDLSGGERQRVAIARAVVGDRHLLLADEPSGALDTVNGEAVMRLVRETCQGGVAGVVVTHDAQLASWADRVVFLRDGRVVDQTARRPGRSRCSTRTRPDDHHLAPPPPSLHGDRDRGGAPARRAIRRWAWRLLRREWRQQILVLALLIVAVAATTVGLGLVRTRKAPIRPNSAPPTPGSTSRLDSRARGVAADLAAARQQFGTAEAIVDQSVPVPGSITPVDLRARIRTAYTATDAAAGFRPLPDRRRQAAVTGQRRDAHSACRSVKWTVDGRARRVVGIVENPKRLAGRVRAGRRRANQFSDQPDVAVQRERLPGHQFHVASRPGSPGDLLHRRRAAATA